MRTYTEPLRYIRDYLPGKRFQELVERYGGRSVEIPADTTEEEDAAEILRIFSTLKEYHKSISIDFEKLCRKLSEEYGYPEEEIRELFGL